METAARIAQLRHKEDVPVVLLMVLVFAAQVTGYLFIHSRGLAVGLAALLLLPEIVLSTVVHNQGHLTIFRKRWLNHLSEGVLFLQTGMFASMFRLHHNQGHHLYYLDPSRDPSAWIKPNGEKMGRLRYIARYYFTYLPQVIRIGRQHPRLLAQCFAHLAVGYGAMALLVARNPFSGVVLFLVPALLVWINFIHLTYEDHIDLYSKDPYQASHTKKNRLVNLLFFNNGYHLAHHLKPGIHWSQLPGYHARIQDRISVPPPNTFINRKLAS